MFTSKKRVFILTIAGLLLLASCKKEKPEISSVTFEDLAIGSSGYWNGSDLTGGFESGNIFFPNHFSSLYQSWSGFVFTNHTDNVTPGYINQYSSIAGSGAANSEKYGVFYFSGIPDTLKFNIAEKVTGISFSNSTYAYYSIKDGNQFCKKFGGTAGTDPDWFILKLTAIGEQGTAIGTVELNLADFRFTDNTKDYISNTWKDIDLSTFGFIKALKFEMSSSDSGVWGMNTPAYVCVDNITGEILKQ